MVKTIALAALFALGLATPAGAQALKRPASDVTQAEFPPIKTSQISGGRIEQGNRVDPRDLIKNDDGSFRPKPNARLAREARTCRLSAADAQAISMALAHARISPEQWDALGSDMTIRFEGVLIPDGPLTAVLEGFPEQNPNGEMRIFYAGVAAFLSREDQAVVYRIAKAVGCPLSEPRKD